MRSVQAIAGNRFARAVQTFSRGMILGWMALASAGALAAADITVQKTGRDLNGGTPVAGDTIRWTIVLTNNCAGDVSGCTLEDVLHSDTTYIDLVGDPPQSSTATLGRRQGNDLLVVEPLDLNCGDPPLVIEFEVTLDATPGPFEQISNIADFVCGNETFRSNRGFVDNNPPQPCGLDIFKDVDNRSPAAGQTIVYTVTFEETADADKDPIFNDNLPVYLDGSTVAMLQTPAGATVNQNGNQLSVNNWTLPALGTEVIQFSVQVRADTPPGTDICNQADVTVFTSFGPCTKSTDDPAIPDPPDIEDPTCVTTVDDPCAGTPDADGDGVKDDCDVCPGGDDKLDADGDGVPDDCDVCEGGDDALDADGDGVPDFCDICPGGDDNVDSDGDGVPDFCDICADGDDTVDSDGDGVPDACDLCEGGDDNVDTDGDGIPDDCDPCVGGTPPASGPGPSLRYVDPASFQWAVVADATEYPVYRGTIPVAPGGLSGRPNPYDHACLERVTVTQYSDADPNATDPDTIAYYLVGAINECGEASEGLGYDWNLTPRPVPGCP